MKIRHLKRKPRWTHTFPRERAAVFQIRQLDRKIDHLIERYYDTVVRDEMAYICGMDMSWIEASLAKTHTTYYELIRPNPGS